MTTQFQCTYAVFAFLSALRPPRATVPAQRTQRTNAVAAARCDNDNTAMRPLATLLWTLVNVEEIATGESV